MKRFATAVRNFHLDESGESSSLSNVFMLAIGALVMFGVFNLWDGKVKTWVNTSIGDLTGIAFNF